MHNIYFTFNTNVYCVSLLAQTVKNPLAIQETSVISLGGKDSVEKAMANHSSILTWEIPWTGEPSGLHGVTKSGT